jgi:peptidoglycan/LPS O-acetylase OafA/YrhL
VRRRYHLMKKPDVHVFRGLVVTLNALIPSDLRRMLLFAVLPYIVYAPIMMTFQVTEYFPQVRYLWLIIGSQIHAIIAIGLLYAYRKKNHYKWYMIITIFWFFSTILLTTFTTKNEQVFNNYIIALLMNTLLSMCITFKVKWNRQHNKE